jgi:RND family efflux transporter MFP subunit
VVIDCDARPGQPIEAMVTRVARRLDPSTRTMVAEIDLDNHDKLLLPGMFGRATITARIQADALVLPASAVRMSSVGEPHVLVLDAENRVSRVPVVIGADDGREIEIVEGLTGDERVVDAVVGTIEPGQQVEVISR